MNNPGGFLATADRGRRTMLRTVCRRWVCPLDSPPPFPKGLPMDFDPHDYLQKKGDQLVQKLSKILVKNRWVQPHQAYIAADIAQEAFCRILEKLQSPSPPKFASEKPLWGYLVRIAQRLSFSRRRSQISLDQLIEQSSSEPEAPQVPPSQVLTDQEEWQRIIELTYQRFQNRSNPEILRRTLDLLLTESDETTIAETLAEEFQCSKGTGYRYILRVKITLQKIVQSRGNL
ncbi:MAG: hypothetical protein NZ602_09645 [Thermoguttaceae bacterium]|nr:hypothetical protein [Thermoguttaceae bacterium]MDW8038737.1 hypothetical protein [Thermoguttaceae bacterium]